MQLKIDKVSPESLPPNVRMAVEKLRAAQQAAMTPEQHYEQAYKRLPKAAQYIAPSTIGEAGNVAGMGLAAAGIALAPETFGTSTALAAPLIGSVIGGAFQDPKNRLGGAIWEGVKGLGQELAGGVLAKGTELASRFALKNQFLQQTARRIGNALPQLFSRYPLKIPTTAEELENQIPSGQLKEAAGKELGAFRDELRTTIREYKPGSKPQLLPASSGVPWRYGPATRPKGVKFTLPDIGSDGRIISRDMSIGDAIDHVRSLQAAGWSTTGSPKSAQEAWIARQAAHDARTTLIAQLNRVQPKLGDEYGLLSGDYGASVHLEKIFKQSYRPDRQVDQAAILRGVRNEIDDLAQFKGSGRALRFREAVAPGGMEALPETSMAGHLHGGLEGMRGRLRIPHPYYPETRVMIPQPLRAITSKQAIPVVGYGAEKGFEDLLEE